RQRCRPHFSIRLGARDRADATTGGLVRGKSPAPSLAESVPSLRRRARSSPDARAVGAGVAGGAGRIPRATRGPRRECCAAARRVRRLFVEAPARAASVRQSREKRALSL